MNYQKGLIYNIAKYIVLISISSLPAYSAEENKTTFITKMCMISFNNEMKNNSTKPPLGMASYTCECFQKKLNSGYSINKSQRICKELAKQEFNL